MEGGKPILALATHPSEPELVMLTADGLLRGYSTAGVPEALTALYAVQGAGVARVHVRVCDGV